MKIKNLQRLLKKKNNILLLDKRIKTFETFSTYQNEEISMKLRIFHLSFIRLSEPYRFRQFI